LVANCYACPSPDFFPISASIVESVLLSPLCSAINSAYPRAIGAIFSLVRLLVNQPITLFLPACPPEAPPFFPLPLRFLPRNVVQPFLLIPLVSSATLVFPSFTRVIMTLFPGTLDKSFLSGPRMLAALIRRVLSIERVLPLLLDCRLSTLRRRIWFLFSKLIDQFFSRLLLVHVLCNFCSDSLGSTLRLLFLSSGQGRRSFPFVRFVSEPCCPTVIIHLVRSLSNHPETFARGILYQFPNSASQLILSPTCVLH